MKGLGIITLILATFAAIVAGVYGWVMNIITLFGGTIDHAGEIIVRVVGIFIPLIGAVAGYV